MYYLTLQFKLYGKILHFYALFLQVSNYLPSISSAISRVPERYIWRCCIGLHSAPRYLVAAAYFNFYYGRFAKSLPELLLSGLALICSLSENTGLLLLTYVSSSETYSECNCLERSRALGCNITLSKLKLTFCITFSHNIKTTLNNLLHFFNFSFDCHIPINLLMNVSFCRYSQKRFYCVYRKLSATHAHYLQTMACDQKTLCESRGKQSFVFCVLFI